MPRRLTFAAVLFVLAGTIAHPAAQQPTFKAGVDLLRLDVRIVSDDGTPVTDLEGGDFDVRVNGTSCPVETLQFTDFTAGERASEESRYRDVSTNISPAPRRLTVIAIDEDSLPQDSRPLMETLANYVKALGPNDRTALLALPRPGIWHEFTGDAGEIRNLLLRISSRNTSADMNAMAEHLQLDRGEVAAPGTSPGHSQIEDLEIIHSLEDLARALKPVEGPKTLIFVSSRLPSSIELDDYHNFANEAAEARLTIYVLRPHVFGNSAVGNQSAIGEPLGPIEGLDILAGMTGGVVLNAIARATGVIERIGRETSGNYVLGVEPPPGIPRNKPLDVTVHVKRPGVTVRSPKTVIAPARGGSKSKGRKTPQDPKTVVGNLLREPRVATDVPLRVSAYSTASTEPGKLKTVIVAELDESARDAGTVAWGFEVRDGDRIAADGFEQAPGGSSAAREVVVGTAPLAPGTYALRLGTIDAAGRRASVEHPLEVGLFPAGDVHVSDLFVGETVDGRFQPRITVDSGADALVTFVEVYPTDMTRAGSLGVEFTLRGLDGASRAAARAPVRPVQGLTKAIAQASLPLAHVGPGLYDVVATVLDGGNPVGTVRREVVIGRER